MAPTQLSTSTDETLLASNWSSNAPIQALRHKLLAMIHGSNVVQSKTLTPIQSNLLARGGVDELLAYARDNYDAAAFEVLQLLCYRNRRIVQRLMENDVLSVINNLLAKNSTATRAAKISCVFLLAAVISFSVESHAKVLAIGLPHRLVELCREEEQQTGDAPPWPGDDGSSDDGSGDGLVRALLVHQHSEDLSATSGGATPNGFVGGASYRDSRVDSQGVVDAPSRSGSKGVEGLPEGDMAAARSLSEQLDEALAAPSTCPATSIGMSCAMALRGLSHNEACHATLLEVGAVEVLASMMEHKDQAPAQRINAAMAVAILVGHEESSSVQLELGELASVMLDALRHACQQKAFLGFYWTVWKLLQAFANLAVNETNKEVLVLNGAVDVFALCLLGKHHNMPIVIRYTLVTLWHLAFLDEARLQIRAREDVVEYMRALVHSGRHDAVTMEVAKGCLWTIGCMNGLRSLQSSLNMQSAMAIGERFGESVSNRTSVDESVSGHGVKAKSERGSLQLPGASQQPPADELIHSVSQHLQGAATSQNGGSSPTLSRDPSLACSDAFTTSIDLRHDLGHTRQSEEARLDRTCMSFTAGDSHKAVPHLPPRGAHIMISYEWGSQAKALALKMELESRQWVTWLDLDKMSGSTLEAMALAVEGAAAVVVCVTKKYKESQACRTEAEYAFRLKKRIIPVMMEFGYQPNGWLGALLGTKLYFDMSDRRNIPDKVRLLERELADVKHLVVAVVGEATGPVSSPGQVNTGRASPHASPTVAGGLGARAWRAAARPSVMPRTSSMNAMQGAGHNVRHSVDLTCGGMQGHGFARGAIQAPTRFSRRTSMSVSASQIGRSSIHIGAVVDNSGLEAIRESDRASSGEKSLDGGAGKDAAASRSPADSASAMRENASGVALASMSSLFGGSSGGSIPKPSPHSHHSHTLPHVTSLTSIVQHGLDIEHSPALSHGHSVHSSDGKQLGPPGPSSHRLQFLDMEGASVTSDSDDDGSGSEMSSIRPGGVFGTSRASGASSVTLADPGWDWSQVPVEQWTLAHVVRWLADVSLTDLVPYFTKHKVDGRALGGLQRLAKQGELRLCLREDLGITRIGSMLGFIDELYKLMD